MAAFGRFSELFYTDQLSSAQDSATYPKVSLTYLVIYLNWTLMFGWCVVRCGFKNGKEREKKKCSKKRLNHEVKYHQLFWIQ